RRFLRDDMVARRIDHGDGRGDGPARHRIVGRRLAVEGEMEDLAGRLVRILRGKEALALARAQEQRPAVGREGDDRAEMAARAPGQLPPEHAEILDPRGPVRLDQPAATEGEAAAALARLGIAEIDEAAV